MCGLVQAAKAEMMVNPEDSWHSEVAPASPENDHAGLTSDPVGPGPDVRAVDSGPHHVAKR